MWLWANIEKVSAVAQILTALLAVFALRFAAKQIHAGREAQREATAKDLYFDYLMLAFNHPSLAYPDGNKNLIEDDKYRWFVSILLNSCEEILACFPEDKIWSKVIAAELEHHSHYLDSKLFSDENEDRGWMLYSDELMRLYEHRVEVLVK